MEKNKQLRILLVDDDDLSRRMMGLLLSDQGYSYDTASNGVEAVEAVQSQQYDFVLMDLQMPVLDGFEATRRIRAWEKGDQHIPIVALTAMLFADEVNLCMEAGMDDCVTKPFDTKQLLQMVESYSKRSKELRKASDVEGMAQVADTPLLDIKSALERFSGDIQSYQEFLNEFISLLPEKIDEFRAAFLSNDLETLSKSAHNLKGVSASLGALQLSNLALELDQQCRKNDTELIPELLTEIESNVSIFSVEAIKELHRFTHGNVDSD